MHFVSPDNYCHPCPPWGLYGIRPNRIQKPAHGSHAKSLLTLAFDCSRQRWTIPPVWRRRRGLSLAEAFKRCGSGAMSPCLSDWTEWCPPRLRRGFPCSPTSLLALGEERCLILVRTIMKSAGSPVRWPQTFYTELIRPPSQSKTSYLKCSWSIHRR